MISKDKILDKIRFLGKKVLPKGSHLLLYGSRARGDNRTDSDWDLLILLNRPQKEDLDFASISYPLMELGFSLGQYFSVHTYSQLQTMREKSDYNCTYNATEEDTAPRIEQTRQFIDKVLNLIKQ